MPTAITLPHKLDRATMTCQAVIETPKGARSKYDYDPDSGLFRLATLLPEGMSFPLDFGFFPSTKAEDGDPLDVLVLHDEPIPTAALVDRPADRRHRGRPDRGWRHGAQRPVAGGDDLLAPV